MNGTTPYQYPSADLNVNYCVKFRYTIPTIQEETVFFAGVTSQQYTNLQTLSSIEIVDACQSDYCNTP
jgi:hypothetical protein